MKILYCNPQEELIIIRRINSKKFIKITGSEESLQKNKFKTNE